MIKFKSLAKGAASFYVERFRNSPTGSNGSFTAEGSYAIFMRYVMALGEAGVSLDNKSVVEFGAGSSFGVGIAALLCGARCYYPFDLIDHTTDERNLAVFDEILALLKSRASIPVDGWCSRVFPVIDDPTFPSQYLPDSLLIKSLDRERIDRIRQDLKTKGGVYIRPRSSMSLAQASIDEPADIIISESVMEHVDDLVGAYEAFARWLAPDGIMVHLIDYGSHNLTPEWNGHWQCSPRLWALARGKRYYLINRVPHHGHLDLLKRNGMEVVKSQLLRRLDGFMRGQLDPDFASMPAADATTALAQVVCKRAASTSAGSGRYPERMQSAAH